MIVANYLEEVFMKRMLSPAVQPKLIDNCEGGGIGGTWDVYSDVKDNGGSSVSNPSPFVLQKDPGKGAKGSDGYANCSAP